MNGSCDQYKAAPSVMDKTSRIALPPRSSLNQSPASIPCSPQLALRAVCAVCLARWPVPFTGQNFFPVQPRVPCLYAGCVGEWPGSLPLSLREAVSPFHRPNFSSGGTLASQVSTPEIIGKPGRAVLLFFQAVSSEDPTLILVEPCLYPRDVDRPRTCSRIVLSSCPFPKRKLNWDGV